MTVTHRSRAKYPGCRNRLLGVRFARGWASWEGRQSTGPSQLLVDRFRARTPLLPELPKV